MSQPGNTDTERLARISARATSRRANARPKLVFGLGFALLLGAASLWALAPGQVRSLLGLGTSEAEKMQQPMPTSAGLSTEIPRGAAPAQTGPLNTELLPATAPRAGMIPEDQARIAALEAEIAALRGKESLGRADLQVLLDANAAQMRSEMNRMLLSRQAPVTAGISPNSSGEAEARKRMEDERARRAAIDAAQVKSRGLVLDGAGGAATGGGAGANRRRSGDESFLASAATLGHETVRATALADPGRMIVQGTLLEGVLETAISTDLPGAVRAVLSQDVLSYDGSATLLPKGTRLIGSYSADVRIAQRRALIAWTRAITPDGTSVALGGIGADALGRSGQTGEVDTHFWERFGSAALISIFGLAPQVAIDERTNGDVADAIEDVGDDLRAASSGALDAYLRIAPTINVSQGDRLTIFVNRDLVF